MMTSTRPHRHDINAAELAGSIKVASHATETVARVLTAARKMLDMDAAEQLDLEELETTFRRLAVETAGIQVLLATIEARDGYTSDHAWFVAAFSREVARLMELPEEEVIVIWQAALLHDVGKVAISDSILNKQGSLDEAELEAMQEHVAVGARMVGSIQALAHLAPIIRATHERWDGKGYPDGLSGEDIPLASRIIHACDAWHAMTSDRPYRDALGWAALDELQNNAG